MSGAPPPAAGAGWYVVPVATGADVAAVRGGIADWSSGSGSTLVSSSLPGIATVGAVGWVMAPDLATGAAGDSTTGAGPGTGFLPLCPPFFDFFEGPADASRRFGSSSVAAALRFAVPRGACGAGAAAPCAVWWGATELLLSSLVGPALGAASASFVAAGTGGTGTSGEGGEGLGEPLSPFLTTWE